MIFPPHCKFVGSATTAPYGERVYFLSRYLVRETPDGMEVLEVEPDPEGTGLMRRVLSARVIAAGDEVYCYPDRVNVQDRTLLVSEAIRSGHRCTIFTGHGEQTTFVLDPDLSGFLRIHVYDITPPRPHLSSTLTELERTGLFGDLEVVFEHHTRDIREIQGDVYPCRAAGFPRTLDADPVRPGDRVVGCLTAQNLVQECCDDGITVENICPLGAVAAEPFIARCCRSERAGLGRWNGRFGAVVHWGASAWEIAQAVRQVATAWREKHGEGSGR
ncbi:hypothetical protein F8E02_06225 [Methanoculleus sp. Wushi-C6]|uniref:Urease accessory protein UreD n=1 Tax=Methanoculleus caldifontis TaxID=2651577 RepID=A0ABU3X0Q7_9EURY|nr:hypothetical protein [Methanoculleus sp. Wushi-C6]MDV2481608.1 hypothetical protein [Methanoculleus sp. Wushi-C6]